MSPSNYRFHGIRPQLVESSAEPTLFTVLVHYYKSNGIPQDKALDLAYAYVDAWVKMEVTNASVSC